MSELLPTEKKQDSNNEEVPNKSELNFQKSKLPSWRFFLAIFIALLADTIGAPLGESFAVIFDVFVAILLGLTLGFDSFIIIALIAEAIPGVGLFPSWVVAVLAIAAKRK